MNSPSQRNMIMNFHKAGWSMIHANCSLRLGADLDIID